MSRNFLAICILLFSNTALAQCPSGIDTPGCVPPDGPGWGWNNAPSQRSSHWVKTWGALAKEMGGGPFGASTGENSERGAKRAAIKDCQKHGGKKCEILLSYHNQCVTVAFGKGMAWAHGPKLEETKQDAISSCNSNEGEGECYIYYSNCTEPYFVK